MSFDQQCPKCLRFGIEWDGRAKALVCGYHDCRHVIQMKDQKKIPTYGQIREAIERDKSKCQKKK